MAVDIQGILNPFDSSAQIVNDIHVFAINWFSNRCPLVTRVPRLPATSDKFDIVNRFYRARTATLAAAIVTGDSTMTVDDASKFMVGDVLELMDTAGTSIERVEVTADPNVSTNVLTIKRAVEGTTARANTAAGNTTIRLIGNSRTGGEVDQTGAAFKPVAVSQYCQTFQHPVQIAGSLQATPGYQLAPGVASPFDQNKMEALQNMMDDMEVSSYYGMGEVRGSGTSRPKQKGLKTLIATNKTVSPTNAGAYKPTDLMRDTFEKCRSNGGDPDVLLVSTNFMTGLATWGHPAQRLEAGSTIFGTPINVFEAPFLGAITIIEAPLLRPYTAIALTSSEVRMRMKRNEFWNPRGVRGDAIEGEWIAEGAIEIANEQHHGWVEGITAFSAT
ncbi:MAG: DUF5309 family protein [Isosphaeraceae bacterium]